jgi:hypothetical protein
MSLTIAYHHVGFLFYFYVALILSFKISQNQYRDLLSSNPSITRSNGNLIYCVNQLFHSPKYAGTGTQEFNNYGIRIIGIGTGHENAGSLGKHRACMRNCSYHIPMTSLILLFNCGVPLLLCLSSCTGWKYHCAVIT